MNKPKGYRTLDEIYDQYEKNPTPTYPKQSQPLVERDENGEVKEIHAPTITIPASSQPMVVNISIDIDASTQIVHDNSVTHNVKSDVRVGLGDSVIGILGNALGKMFD